MLTELKKWLEERKGKVLPKSVLGQAVGYALNHWAALVRYREQGYLAIDNNLSERTLRAIAVGRHNWVVLGSERGGHQTGSARDLSHFFLRPSRWTSTHAPSVVRRSPSR